MQTTGIIVEFNPLHNGHIAHITETRKLTKCKYIVAVISGNFVQRGEPAICDKWKRTRMALLNGVDIVIEIPVPYVISGADYFARGSVQLLNATGVVDSLCFGSESGNLQEITVAGQVLAQEPVLYKHVLHDGLGKGLSFAAARGAALGACINQTLTEGLLTKPNNGLAIEYCKANILMGEHLEIFTTHRVSGGPSATKIRNMLARRECVQGLVPASVVNLLQDVNKFAQLDDFSDIFRYLLYTRPEAIDSLREGVGNRFRRMSSEFTKISDLLGAVKTKRYTYTRLQRDVLRILLDILPDDMEYFEQNGGVQYVRILGFRKEAANLIGEIARKASLPVITNNATVDRLLKDGGAAAKMLSQEFMAGDVYGIACGEKRGYCSERREGIVVV